jgi:hypothetical protein
MCAQDIVNFAQGVAPLAFHDVECAFDAIGRAWDDV